MSGLNDSLQKLVEKGHIGQIELLLGQVTGEGSLSFAANRRVTVQVIQKGGTLVEYKDVPISPAVDGNLQFPALPPVGRFVILAVVGKGWHQGQGHGAVIIAVFDASFASDTGSRLIHEATSLATSGIRALAGNSVIAGIAEMGFKLLSPLKLGGQ